MAGHGREIGGLGGLSGRYRFRAFQPEDAAAALGFVPNSTAVGVTAECEGRVAGYGGVHIYEGRHWVFFHLSPDEDGEGLRRPMFLHRTVGRCLRAIIGSCGIDPVHALCEDARPRARAWLAALGFRPMEAGEKDAGIVQLEQRRGSSAWVMTRGGA